MYQISGGIVFGRGEILMRRTSNISSTSLSCCRLIDLGFVKSLESRHSKVNTSLFSNKNVQHNTVLMCSVLPSTHLFCSRHYLIYLYIFFPLFAILFIFSNLGYLNFVSLSLPFRYFPLIFSYFLSFIPFLLSSLGLDCTGKRRVVKHK